MKKALLFFTAVFLAACQNNSTQSDSGSASETKEKLKISTGSWRGAIALNDSTEMPFIFKLQEESDSSYRFIIHNAEERINATAIKQGDSLKITMPVFANYIKASAKGGKMKGVYVNPDAKNYELPFSATAGEESRFPGDSMKCCDINKKWRVEIGPESEDPTPAVAYFEQDSNQVSGTFMTETGDYRYLDGSLHGRKLQLSTFDGAHLFYFEADIENGQKMIGRFYSGRSYMEPWKAWRDEDFELADPESLTYLKSGYKNLKFSFPDLNGDTVSLTDPRFEGKPVIVQILGSWCPNCMDESRYLKEVYKQYNDEGLEIVGLTFERARDKATAKKRAQKMIDDLELPYPVLMAGYTRNDDTEEALPMLNHIMSYPTAIYLNKNHKVVKIHTGFSGPGTPVYDKFTATNKAFIEDLVNNRASE